MTIFTLDLLMDVDRILESTSTSVPVCSPELRLPILLT